MRRGRSGKPGLGLNVSELVVDRRGMVTTKKIRRTK